MTTLNATTIVVDPATRAGVVLAAGGPVPSWATDQVGDHLLQVSSEVSDEVSPEGPPPKAGKGSSREAWAEYADANDVGYGPDDGRDDIIAAVEAAGVPTE